MVWNSGCGEWNRKWFNCDGWFIVESGFIWCNRGRRLTSQKSTWPRNTPNRTVILRLKYNWSIAKDMAEIWYVTFTHTPLLHFPQIVKKWDTNRCSSIFSWVSTSVVVTLLVLPRLNNPLSLCHSKLWISEIGSSLKAGWNLLSSMESPTKIFWYILFKFEY